MAKKSINPDSFANNGINSIIEKQGTEHNFRKIASELANAVRFASERIEESAAEEKNHYYAMALHEYSKEIYDNISRPLTKAGGEGSMGISGHTPPAPIKSSELKEKIEGLIDYLSSINASFDNVHEVTVRAAKTNGFWEWFDQQQQKEAGVKRA